MPLEVHAGRFIGAPFHSIKTKPLIHELINRMERCVRRGCCWVIGTIAPRNRIARPHTGMQNGILAQRLFSTQENQRQQQQSMQFNGYCAC